MKGTDTVDRDTILKKYYPRFTPKRGVHPDNGDPTKHLRVDTPEAHQRENPEDYNAMLTEAPASGIGATEIAVAVDKERERCARIAEGTGGKYGKNIAAEIRGEQPPPED